MTELRYDNVRVGTELPALQAEPISRLTLALYCGASGDHNPIHVDSDFARAAGRDDVRVPGEVSAELRPRPDDDAEVGPGVGPRALADRNLERRALRRSPDGAARRGENHDGYEHESEHGLQCARASPASLDRGGNTTYDLHSS